MDLDEQLREAGEQWRAAERAPVADFRRATQVSYRVRTPRRSRTLILVALAAGALVLIGAVVLFGDDASSPQKVVVTQPTIPTTALTPPTTLELGPEIVQTAALAIDGASVWVTGDAPRSGAATLVHIDTRTGKVLGTVELRDNGPFQITVGDGAVWVCSQQNEESAHLTKVDPTTMRITAVVETAGDAAVAVTPDAVWVDVGSGELLRLDPVTNKVLARITLPGGGYSAHWITAGPLGVFLANNYDGTVLHVNPATNTVKMLTDIGDAAYQLVELDGRLWINAWNRIVQIDPTTGAVRQTIQRSARGLVSDGRSLWTNTNGPTVLRIDPQRGGVAAVPLPAGVKLALDIAGDPVTGAVWVAPDTPSQRLLRLSP